MSKKPREYRDIPTKLLETKYVVVNIIDGSDITICDNAIEAGKVFYEKQKSPFAYRHSSPENNRSYLEWFYLGLKSQSKKYFIIEKE